MEQTRIIELKIEKLNRYQSNDCTVVLPFTPKQSMSMKEMFIEHFDAFRKFSDACGEGVSTFAVSEDGLVAQAFIASKKSTVNSLIIGRHGMCELYLSGDPRISLRHLTLLLYPKSKGFRFRLLDLRSSLSFQNEHGDLCKSVEADGPLFVRLGMYTLFFFPTKSDIFRSPTPRKAWAALPRRLYDEQMFLPPTSPDNEDDDISSVFSLPPPKEISSCSLGDIVAEMELDCKSKKVVVSIDQASLETGILLGRYGRCDSVASSILNVNYISRVHLLLILIGGEIYVIDTGSTNGCYYRDKRFTRLQLENNREITLGKSGKAPFFLRWKSV